MIKFLRSMKFALILLVTILIICLYGSINTAADVFHTWWFITLSALLCVSLVACNLSRFPAIMKQMKAMDGKGMDVLEPDAHINGQAEPFFQKMGFKNLKKENGRIYSVRNKIGMWGAWLTHLGILIIILGFGLGQFFMSEYSVYGVPGQTKPVGNSGYSIKIEDFSVCLRADDTVDQYTSIITMTEDSSGKSAGGTVSVNHPLKLFGMKLYQNSTGWAAQCRILNGDKMIADEVLCAGEEISVPDKPALKLFFMSFYPDFTMEGGYPSTASPNLNNPGYMYVLYYGDEMIGMNVLTGEDKITVDDYTLTLSNPQQYTLISAKNDPFTMLALTGGIIILLALILAFYTRTEELLAVKDEKNGWNLYGRSRKGGVLFKDKLTEEAEKYE